MKVNKTLIIAEIGECFNGEMEVAKQLIAEAQNAGCDIVKFQTLDYENIAANDPEKKWFQKISLTPGQINILIDFANKTGIEILFTPENVKTAQWLLDVGLDSLKIASSTLADKELFEFINKHFETVYMSTGMASLQEIKDDVNALADVDDLWLMHCISEYPTGPLLDQRGLKALDPSDANLNMMKILMDSFPHLKVGYSDHTDGVLAPVVAVAAGAKVIEKHITLDKQTPIRNFEAGGTYLGTDHVLSIEPKDLKEMVRQIRETEKMFGEMKWERTEGEKILIEFLRGRFANE